jgi:MraZ protein
VVRLVDNPALRLAAGVFLGTFGHNLDAKGRLAIPARFREALGGQSVLTRGVDRCLVIYPADAWQSLATRVDALPLTDQDARMYRRFLFADAAMIEPDGQGRIVLPADLRGYAEIERGVVVVGMDSAIEIWADTRWLHVRETLDAQAAEFFERLRA